MNKLVLIDGNSLMFRAYYATAYTGNLMQTKAGFYTNALYGFVNMINKVLETEKPTYLFVAFDKGKKTRRHQEYADYKGGRKPMPEEFAMQIPLIKEYLDVLKIKQLSMDEFEADDIIGSLAMQNYQAVDEVVILTGDRDLLQLVGNNRCVSLTKKGITDLETYTKDNFYDLLGFYPNQLADYKALIGDSSDNLPGVTGVGPKTAVKLLNDYQTIENIVTKPISGKLGENIRNDTEIALRTKHLATLITDINFDFKLDDMLYVPCSVYDLRKFYEKVEFTSFIRRLDMKKGNDTKVSESKTGNEQMSIFDLTTNKEEKVDSNFITYFNDLTAFKEENLQDKVIDLEVELDQENYHKGNLLGFGLAIENHGYFFNSNYLYDDAFKDFFNKHHFRMIDSKRVICSLHYKGITIKDVDFDLMLAAYTIDPSYGNKEIKTIIDMFIDSNLPYKDEIYGSKTNYQIPDEKIYGTYCLNKLKNLKFLQVLINKTLKEQDQMSLLYEMEIPLAKVLAKMELGGFKVKKSRLEEIGVFLQKEMNVLEVKIYELAGEKFNISSPKQLGVILFEKLQLDKGKKNKTGYNTSADVLEKLANDYELPRLILQYRKYAKLYSTYVVGLTNEISLIDGKVHTTFKQALTLTGRLSSTEPNIQNIPIRTEDGRLIRSAFIPETSDGVIVSADYSQIELRILACLSNCEMMIKDINDGIDLHTATASKIYNIPPTEVTKDMRRTSKAVNFGIVYGISDWGLAEQLHISPREASGFIARYFEIYPEIKSYLDNVIEEAKINGYTTTIFKRRRSMKDINSSNVALRKFTERTAMNAPIQGSAADIIKLAMIKMDQEMTNHHLKSKLVAQVHDELIIDTVKEEIEIVKTLMKETMENAIKLSVQFDVDTEVGVTWDLK